MPGLRGGGWRCCVDIVLVHGAWHGGWCWRDVVAALRAAGHRAYAPTLTGLGERRHLRTPELGIETHVQDICQVIEAEELEEVVLVGHSYGGMIITGVAARLPERLRSLVYLDAIVPEDGQSFLTSGPAKPPEALAASRERLEGMADETGGVMAPPPTVFGIPEADSESIAWVQRRLTPHPLRTMLDPLRLGGTVPEALPKTFILCTRPALDGTGIPWHAERLRGKAGWTVVELETGHDAMVTEPQRVTALILDHS